MDRSRIALVIPAYNEARTIYHVVKAALEYGQPIVVDDCSSDETADLAIQAGALVVSHNVNKGYDAALNSGFAKAKAHNYEFIITLDADGQHDPTLLDRFINGLDQGADVVLGVRNTKPRLAEHIFAFYSRLRYGIQDPLCGMKAYRRSVYEDLGHFDSYRSIGTELALHSVKSKYLVSQIKFIVRDRIDKPRFGRLASANFRILRAMFFDIFSCIRIK